MLSNSKSSKDSLLKTPLKVLKDIDQFGAPVPSHNLRGETKLNTRLGGCLTLAVLAVTLAFGLFKLEHMLRKKNPSIVKNDVTLTPGSDGYRLDLGDPDFMLAVIMTDVSNRAKDDPKYIQYVAVYVEHIGESTKMENYPMPKCTEEDLARFYSMQGEAEAAFQTFKDSLFCLHPKVYEKQLYGQWESQRFSSLLINIISCDQQYEAFDGTIHGGGDECEMDEMNTRYYMGIEANIYTVLNNGNFNADSYGAESISRQAQIKRSYLLQHELFYQGIYLDCKKHTVSDETAYV